MEKISPRMDDPATRPELTAATQSQMVDRLQQALQKQHLGRKVEHVETHISHVLVTPTLAYKFKKPLALGFLDFSTLARRRHFCEEELRLNRRLAPDLYLDVVPVTGSPDAPELGGRGVPIDQAVRMRAFDQDGLWDRLAARGALQAANIDTLASLLWDFQRNVVVAGADSPYGTAQAVHGPVLDNLSMLDGLLVGAAARQALASLRDWDCTVFDELEPVFAQRHAAGCVREGHGDLHLGNVAQIDGRTVVFDGIEFSEELRWIDVVSDLAFMAMDLHGHGLAKLAHRLVNTWFERSGDYGGARVLRYYLVYRALVRAKVAALRAGQKTPRVATGATPHDDTVARRYLDEATASSRHALPVLVITHGLPGSGKTTLTQGLIEATGAIRVRADVERKRLFGLEAHARSGSALGAGLYSAEADEATHERLRAAAADVLRGGHTAVIDATFLRRHQRDRARALSAAHGVPFVILDVQADAATLRERVLARAARADDASEAGVDVLEAQMRAAEALNDDERDAVVPCRAATDAEPPDWAALVDAAAISHRR